MGQSVSYEQNPCGLDGIEFIEFCGPDENFLASFCARLGLKKVGQHKQAAIQLWRQGDINFLINHQNSGFPAQFKKRHGPSVCSTGFRVKDAHLAYKTAIARGARAFEGDKGGWDLPAIYGIGDSLVYFVDEYGARNIYDARFSYTSPETKPVGKGLMLIDHLTNNVPKGEMQKWCDFYEKVFGFKERRYFDIRGKTTGLISKVMRSPCGKFSIPINEPTDPKSQIQEYLDEYHGSGIQHIALLTRDICQAVQSLNAEKIEFLAAPPHSYYEMLKDRLANVREDNAKLESLGVLADGDPDGYLLQIFTKNQVGPVFIEIIQRENHFGFGEGNFQALFDAMEEDQRRRGVI